MPVYLIAGPPCAGKTTLAERIVKPDDVVLDFDAICTELDGIPGWSHTKPVRERAAVVLDTRAAQLSEHHEDAYLLRYAPEPQERERLAHGLDATVWLLNPGQATCLRRARLTRRPPRTVHAIRDWYTRYRPSPLDSTPPEVW